MSIARVLSRQRTDIAQRIKIIQERMASHSLSKEAERTNENAMLINLRLRTEVEEAIQKYTNMNNAVYSLIANTEDLLADLKGRVISFEDVLEVKVYDETVDAIKAAIEQARAVIK